MTTINERLQQLIDREITKQHTYSVLLGVQSGDGKINFRGAAGEALPTSPYFVASIAKIHTTRHFRFKAPPPALPTASASAFAGEGAENV